MKWSLSENHRIGSSAYNNELCFVPLWHRPEKSPKFLGQQHDARDLTMNMLRPRKASAGSLTLGYAGIL